MRKTLLIVLSALMIAALFAGCSDSTQASESPSQSASESTEPAETASDAAEVTASGSAGGAESAAGLDEDAELEGLSYKISSAWTKQDSQEDGSGEDQKIALYSAEGDAQSGLLVTAIEIEPEFWQLINAESLQPGEQVYDQIVSNWAAAFGENGTKMMDTPPPGSHAAWEGEITQDGETTHSVMIIGENGLEYSLTLTEKDDGSAFSGVWDDLVASLSVS